MVRAHRNPPPAARATREKAAAFKNLGLSSGGDCSDFVAIERTATSWESEVHPIERVREPRDKKIVFAYRRYLIIKRMLAVLPSLTTLMT